MSLSSESDRTMELCCPHFSRVGAIPWGMLQSEPSCVYLPEGMVTRVIGAHPPGERSLQSGVR